MLTVPACPNCNRFFGRWENDARILVLTAQPENSTARRATEALFRSADPAQAKKPKDKRAREHRRRQILSLLTHQSAADADHALWSFGQTMETMRFETEAGIVFDAIPAIRLPRSLQDTVVHKWMRGCYYHLAGQPIPLFVPWYWSAPAANTDPKEIIQEFATASKVVFETLDFRVWGLIVPSNPLVSIWQFAVWNELIFWASSGSDDPAKLKSDR